MIKAQQHQQQPANAAACVYCGEQFNNPKRVGQHTEAKHPEELEEFYEKMRAQRHKQ